MRDLLFDAKALSEGMPSMKEQENFMDRFEETLENLNNGADDIKSIVDALGECSFGAGKLENEIEFSSCNLLH